MSGKIISYNTLELTSCNLTSEKGSAPSISSVAVSSPQTAKVPSNRSI